MDRELDGFHLSTKQAYRAMFEFLKGYYYRLDQPEQLGVLLSGFQLHRDGNPIDPAAWEDWLDAIAAVLNQDDQQAS